MFQIAKDVPVSFACHAYY